jgi:oligoribonuclease (3'-5' exoribonuclease)
MTYVVCIDFETLGSVALINGFTQLGAAIYDVENRNVLSRFNMYANQKDHVMEERCFNQFWSKHLDLYNIMLEKCKESKLSCYQVVDEFWEWLDKNIPDKKQSYFIGDNVVFDYGILKTFSKNKCPLYAFGCYRDIIDVGVYYIAYSKYRLNSAELIDNSNSSQSIKNILNKDIPKFEIEHTHSADNDAINIILKWVWFNSEITTGSYLINSES